MAARTYEQEYASRANEVRKAITRATANGISRANFLKVCERRGFPLRAGEGAFDNFVAGRSKIGEGDLSQLEKFIATHPLGRAITSACVPNDPSPFDELTMALAIGQGSHFRDHDIEGQFFVYHRSYRIDDAIAVRVMEIKRQSDGVIVFRDYLRDSCERVSPIEYDTRGAVVFYSRMPQFVGVNNDIRMGLRLIMIDKAPDPSPGKVEKMQGVMLSSAPDSKVFHRSVYFVRIKSIKSFSTQKKESFVDKWDLIKEQPGGATQHLRPEMALIHNQNIKKFLSLFPSEKIG